MRPTAPRRRDASARDALEDAAGVWWCEPAPLPAVLGEDGLALLLTEPLRVLELEDRWRR